MVYVRLLESVASSSSTCKDSHSCTECTAWCSCKFGNFRGKEVRPPSATNSECLNLPGHAGALACKPRKDLKTDPARI